MNNLLLSVIFGMIGTGYLIYGKRAEHWSVFLVGAALCAFPYFISDPLAVMLVGAVLTLTPFFLKR